MSGRRLLPRAAFLLSLWTAVLAAQTPPFHSESSVVLVPVTVTDNRGEFVTGLKATDFLLTDNGAPRKVQMDSADSGEASISLAVLIESSEISFAALTKVEQIADALSHLVVGPGGSVAIATFDQGIVWRQDFTSEPVALAGALKQIPTGAGKTARMLDALMEASRHLDQRQGRRVVFLISESRDRGSKTNLKTAVQQVQREGILVYSARFSPYFTPFTVKQGQVAPPGREDQEAQPNYLPAFGEIGRFAKSSMLHTLAAATGGEEFAFLQQQSLEDDVSKLGKELHYQDVLSFTPDEDVPGLHHLEIKVRREGRYHVRARQAYWFGK
ncbi:MAG TPA: VWA domain-containing protein [Bryobacteraceae bacterium]|nr:VWA domain-containing protein [Bryobacteraceae bacterium]